MTSRAHHRRALPLSERPRLASALAASALLTALASGTACAPIASAQEGPPSFRLLVRQVLPAVVNIGVTESAAAAAASEESGSGDSNGAPSNGAPSDGHEKVFGAGSGFIIDPSGIIVTNDHVVGGASRITVSLADGTQLPAHILGIDQLTDIAVIKVSAGRPLPFVHWGDSRQAEVGDWILVAGNPFGLGGTVTAGIISARGRDIMSGPFDDFLQLDAPINPGNSGGPAFDMSGGVIGVNTAIISPTGGSVGIGFAIPSQIARGVVTRLGAARTSRPRLAWCGRVGRGCALRGPGDRGRARWSGGPRGAAQRRPHPGRRWRSGEFPPLVSFGRWPRSIPAVRPG